MMNYKGIEIKFIFAIFLLIIFLTSCLQSQNKDTMQINTVKSLDVERYLGKWYEIYRLPFISENGLVNVTATYNIRKDGKIEVINEGYLNSPNGKHKIAKGKAWRPDESFPGKLRVSFFWIFTADYLVIALDNENYQYALVTTSSKKLLWFLSRSPEMTDEIYQKLLKIAYDNGINTNQLIKVVQQWNR
jgi:lipocalin